MSRWPNAPAPPWQYADPGTDPPWSPIDDPKPPDPTDDEPPLIPRTTFGLFFFEECSADDVFEVRPLNDDPGGWRAVSFSNFENLVSGVTAQTALADTTVQRTRVEAKSLLGITFPSGSLRLYLSVEGHGEYSLLSSDGVNFELEGPCLVPGEGQAESYGDGTSVWMYYNDGAYFIDGVATPGICVKKSADGLDFESDADTLYGQGAPTGLTVAGQGLDPGSPPYVPADILAGLSVVKTTVSHKYRGYFGFEPSEPDRGEIYVANSDDLLSWTIEPEAGNVSACGQVIGKNPTSTSPTVIADVGKQPFALKRHDPSHPDAVTLFYYRPIVSPPGSRIFYCTSLDGVTFSAADEKVLDGLGDGNVAYGHDGAVAGPTLTSVRGLRGWRLAAEGTYLLYVDTVVTESDGTQSKFIQAVTLTKAT